MSTNTSLAHLAKQGFLIQAHIEEGKQEIIKNKKKVLGIAEEYNIKYKTEIRQGTIDRQKLLNEHSGEKEEDVLVQYGKFLPSVHTPILNFLHFFVNEGYNNEQEMNREIQDKKYGNLFEDVKHSDSVKEQDDMEQFVYGNCTHTTFKTIKKLKSLANSINNENEAASAFIACKKMCQKYNLDYDKIPS